MPESTGKLRLARLAAFLLAGGSIVWIIAQVAQGQFDLWGPLGVLTAWLSLRGDSADRRRQRLAPGPSTDDLATELADILKHKCRAEVTDRKLLAESGLLPIAWTEVEAGAPGVPVDETRPEQRIRMRFDDAARRLAELFRKDPTGSLVVLGQPGAGKSVLALTLQVGLLNSRAIDEAVPALVSVASWNPLGATLDEFLVDALARAHYGGNPEHPRRLLETGRLLPILDGLDEIPEMSRGTAATAVNEAINLHGRPLVVTCRLVEYEDLIQGGAPPLRKATVIRVLPIRPREAVAYLTPTSPTEALAWAEVLTEIERPGAPLALAYSTPLMLSIARDVYGRLGRDPREQLDPALDSRLAVENRLLDELVDAAYPQPDGTEPNRPPPGRWPKEKASRYLRFLARYLYDVEERDLRWWDFAYLLSRFGTGTVLGTVAGLLMMIATWSCFVAGGGTRDAGLTIGTLVGSMFLLLIMLSWSVDATPPSRLPVRPFSPATIREAIAVTPAPISAILVWVPFAFCSAIAITVVDGWSTSTTSLFLGSMGLGSALLVAVTIGVAVHRWLSAAPASARLDSPRAVLRQDRDSTLVGSTAGGLVVALLLAPLMLTTVVLGSVVYGWTTGGAGWLRGARLPDITRARLADAVPGLFPSWPVAIWILIVVPGLLTCACMLASRAWFRFQIARAVLAGRRVLPWQILGLLEDACTHELLRQVGGTYQFRHLRLQERLADDQSPAYRAEVEAAQARARRRRRVLVPALILTFLGTLAVPLTVAPRDNADTVLRLPYGTAAYDLLVSPDGLNLAVSSDDGIRLWRLDGELEPDARPYFIETAGNEIQHYFNPGGLLFIVHDKVSSTVGPNADPEPRERAWRWAAQGWEPLGTPRPPAAVMLLNGGEQVGMLSATDGRADATLTVYAASGGPARSIHGRFATDLSDSAPPEYDSDGAPVDLVPQRFVLAGQDNGSLEIWDIGDDHATAKVIAEPGGGPNEALLDPSGRWMVVRTRNGARLFDLSLGTSAPLLYREPGSADQVYRETKSELRFDSTGTWLAGSSGTRENQSDDDRTVTVWNTADARQRDSWTLDEDVLDVEFVPGTPALLVETAEQDSNDGTLRILPVGGPASSPLTNTYDHSLYRTSPYPVLVAARRRSAGAPDKRVDIVDARTGAVRHTIDLPGDPDDLDAWTPRPGDREGNPPPIVVTSDNGDTMAWNSVTAQELGPGGHVEWGGHLENPLGTVIAGWNSGRLTLYDARTGARGPRLVSSLPPADDANPTFSADGTYLAVSAAGGAIQVWDLDNSRTIELEGHSGEVSTFVWGCHRTRGMLISAGATDSTVRLWKL
ncbi:hypothetical protein [Actinoplanes sp. NPDC026670]|uniref:hypothetical protein n=1 Tax=Actinoplanes sp. NPDC026670 TaxID=3154700 RepID=UPI0033C9F803